MTIGRTADGHPAHRSLDDQPPVSLLPEEVHVLERLVIAPRAGTFVPALLPAEFGPRGRTLEAGEVLGVVVSTGEEHPVPCPFAGELMGLLALPGERVRPGQPIAWLTTE